MFVLLSAYINVHLQGSRGRAVQGKKEEHEETSALGKGEKSKQPDCKGVNLNKNFYP